MIDIDAFIGLPLHECALINSILRGDRGHRDSAAQLLWIPS
ncbi:hypothetical protein MPS_1152 [Mycobacterium pseudoshottsii JCM 15466]|nr:hypothetical protein MPS_1152 [Mycobacterium pseudoshottsii JCM 15466]